MKPSPHDAFVSLFTAGLLFAGACQSTEEGAHSAKSDAATDARTEPDFDSTDDAMNAAGDGTGNETGRSDGANTDVAGPTPDADVAVGPAEWESAPPVGSGPRQEHDVVVLDSKLYLIGGFDGGQTPTMLDRTEVFDPGTGEWSTAAPFPEPLHHANATVVGDSIYVTGYLVQGFEQKGAVYSYNPSEEEEWTEHTAMPTPRGSSAVATIDGKIYVAGGLRSGSAVTATSVYDPGEDTWSELPDAPRPLDHAGYGAIDGKLVVAGGRDTGISNHTDRVDIFDPEAGAEGSWSTGAPMPTSRAGVASSVWRGRLIVAGGEGNASDSSGVFPEVEMYDPAADRWSALPDLSDPRHGMESGAIDDVLYVPGGGDVRGFGAVATHSRLDLTGLR